MRLSGLDIQLATGGQWHGMIPDTMTSVKTDTRGFEAGDAFLALHGPNFDGHHFAAAIADRAVALIGDARGIRMWKELATAQLEVADTLVALGNIAHAWRMQLKHTTIVAISGSYGKTSLRSILECGFSALGLKVAATSANLNNLIGVPQTLLKVDADSDIALIECGISEQGEMQRLAAIVQPDIAVLTGITNAHAQGLGGLDGVVREKAALFSHMNRGGWSALGEGVADQLQHAGIDTGCPLLSAQTADAVGWSLHGCSVQLTHGSETAVLELELPARHWAANLALAASIMMTQLKQTRPITLGEVADALRQWQTPAGRMQILKGFNGCTVLDDSYNANPVSMQVAVDTLRALSGRRIAVLGDMAELGEDSATAHAELDVSGVDAVYLVGPQMKALAESADGAVWFASTDEAVRSLSQQHFTAQDSVLVKASRSMALEAVVNMLCEPVEVNDAI